jgi:hypothetical protein
MQKYNDEKEQRDLAEGLHQDASRIEEAKRIMENMSDGFNKVESVAYYSGSGSKSSFNVAFEQFTGVKPRLLPNLHACPKSGCFIKWKGDPDILTNLKTRFSFISFPLFLNFQHFTSKSGI